MVAKLKYTVRKIYYIILTAAAIAAISQAYAKYAPQAESNLFTTEEMSKDIKKSLRLIENDHYLSPVLIILLLGR